MSIWGKVIGGTAGFFMGGPLGALIGAAAGHAYDRYKDTQHPDGGGGPGMNETFRAANRQAAFTIAVVALGAKMAKADGVVTKDEIATFKRLFHIPESEMSNVGRLFDQAKRSTHGYEAYAEQIAQLFRGEPAVLEALLDALFAIAMADGELHPNEQRILHHVAHIFGMPDKDFDRVRAEARPAGVGDPYEVLGLTRDASDADVKAAHRRLLKEHHPDVLTAKGMPEEFVEVATKKMAAINAAYDQIKKERGL